MKRKPKTKDVIATVAEYFNINQKDLMGRRHLRAYTRPRQILCYLLRKHREDSYPRIGMTMERDHSTIMHNCRIIEASLKTDYDMIDDVQGIEELLELKGCTRMPEMRPLFSFYADNVATHS